ncbi:unnamed protein product, partial [Vitis vinifera]
MIIRIGLFYRKVKNRFLKLENPDLNVLIWVDGDIFGAHWAVGGVIR